MALPKTESVFDAAAYLDWEETQPERHEFIAGEVFAMAGGSDAHYTIGLNFAAALKSELRASPCRPFIAGMKVQIEAADAVLYPDVFVTCDDRDREPAADLAKRHPLLVVEVLSASTGAYDRGRKFELYQQIPELREYLLIEQDRAHADLFRKNDEGRWVLYPAGPGDVLTLASVGVDLPLATLYEDVELPAAG